MELLVATDESAFDVFTAGPNEKVAISESCFELLVSFIQRISFEYHLVLDTKGGGGDEECFHKDIVQC
jgi:hypothetical protein